MILWISFMIMFFILQLWDMDHFLFNLFPSSLSNLCTCYFRIYSSLSFNYLLYVHVTKKSRSKLALMGIEKPINIW
jgi:hypothetical protein